MGRTLCCSFHYDGRIPRSAFCAALGYSEKRLMALSLSSECAKRITVVGIACIREHLLKIRRNCHEAFFTIAEGGAERLIEVSGRRMEGTAERLP